MRSGAVAALFGVALLLIACADSESASEATRDGETDNLPAELASAREATAEFSDPAAAEEAGYRPTDQCAANPEGDGAMGIHYVNPELMQDSEVTPTEPEVLVYVPTGDGLELGALEWVVPDADQDLSTDDDRPSLFDRDFDGPMEGHEPDQPIHYDLHAWLFTNNPDGLFAPWNPDVTCPE